MELLVEDMGSPRSTHRKVNHVIRLIVPVCALRHHFCCYCYLKVRFHKSPINLGFAFFKKMMIRVAGEMVQQLRALSVLAEDLGGFPAPSWGSELYISPVLGDLCPHLTSPVTHTGQRHTCRQDTHTHQFIFYKKRNKLIRSHSVGQPSLELATILLLQPPKCQDFTFESPHPVFISLFLLHLNNQLFATSPSKLVI